MYGIGLSDLPPALRPVHRGRSARRFTPRNEAADTARFLNIRHIFQRFGGQSRRNHYSFITILSSGCDPPSRPAIASPCA
ncbi:hypothetical protein DM45_2619 [Burkholderia mallei]|nr:hypothetical protein DM45_2619 [Burkholderia mallei]KOT03412.1 hypothetical protein DM77_1402 [Burkholderia mallei]